ncbi:MAG TPA: carboxypeptidase-like regulatory domain-containing protein [Actinomycetota bacterium]|nr:carboxypeptidase-like regulatory domain-containing protein [Actinomycetota bacterium]
MGRRSFAAALLAVLLVACQAGVERFPPGSGIRGRVVAGPACPVETEASPCPDLPWVGKVRATGEAGVFEVRTDQEGGFVLVVPPGTYLVRAVVPGGGPPTAVPQEVRVRPGSFVEVTLEVDTGIR